MACSQILDAMRDECAMYDATKKLLECASLKVRFTAAGEVDTVTKDADPGYNAMKDLTAEERDMVRCAADQAVARVTEQDRQTRLAQFASKSSHAGCTSRIGPPITRL